MSQIPEVGLANLKGSCDPANVSLIVIIESTPYKAFHVGFEPPDKRDTSIGNQTFESRFGRRKSVEKARDRENSDRDLTVGPKNKSVTVLLFSGNAVTQIIRSTPKFSSMSISLSVTISTHRYRFPPFDSRCHVPNGAENDTGSKTIRAWTELSFSATTYSKKMPRKYALT